MNFISRLFQTKLVECPRCLGKGHVDLEDIKRLKKELFWGPGKCAYCKGKGQVHPDTIEKLSADIEYLTVELPDTERQKLLNGDENALQRANAFKEHVEREVKEIEYSYYIENKEPLDIAEFLLHKYRRPAGDTAERRELVDYINTVINSKLKKGE
jgi:hypothetical protein